VTTANKKVVQDTLKRQNEKDLNAQIAALTTRREKNIQLKAQYETQIIESRKNQALLNEA
jgi:N-methylhydantoinase B/oxoprolinase/acetone carboxylase alpha subunit